MIVPRGRIVAIVAASYAGTCRHKHAAAACSIALHFHRAPATVRVIGKKGNVRRRRMDWQARVEELSDPEFTARYRLNKKGFRMLANRLRPKLEPKTRRSNPLSVELQIASTLRYLAGGHHLDLADQIGCSRKTFHTMAAKVVRAIVKVLPKLTFPFGDSDRLRQISDGFASFSNGKLVGTVGCVDGLLVRIKKPRKNGMHFFCQKGVWQTNPPSILHITDAEFHLCRVLRNQLSRHLRPQAALSVFQRRVRRADARLHGLWLHFGLREAERGSLTVGVSPLGR